MAPKKINRDVMDSSQQGVLDALAVAAKALQNYLDVDQQHRRTASTADLCRSYIRTRQLGEYTKPFLVKPINECLSSMEGTQIPERFDEDGITSLPLDEGFRVAVQQLTRAGVRKDMKDSAINWLKSHELGDLVQETINASSLSSAAKELIENGQELPDDIFNVAIMPSVSLTKLKKKAPK